MNQNEKIMKHLANSGHLTRQDAMVNLGVMNVTARVEEIRHHLATRADASYLVTEMTKHPSTGQTYARYSLPKEERAWLRKKGWLELRGGVYYPVPGAFVGCGR